MCQFYGAFRRACLQACKAEGNRECCVAVWRAQRSGGEGDAAAGGELWCWGQVVSVLRAPVIMTGKRTGQDGDGACKKLIKRRLSPLQGTRRFVPSPHARRGSCAVDLVFCRERTWC